MTTEKIFSITGKEVSGETSLKKCNGKKSRSRDAGTYWEGLHIFSTLCACGLAMSILTLIPRHNSILEPMYWFEMIIPAGFASILIQAEFFLELYVLIGKDCTITIKMFLKTLLVSFLTGIGSFAIFFMIWTTMLKYNHPMPFVGLICFFLNRVTLVLSLPALLPSDLMKGVEFHKKVTSFMIFEFRWIMTTFIHSLLATIFRLLENTDVQGIMALLVPLTKRFAFFAFSKMMYRIVGKENERANLLPVIDINFGYGLFNAINLVGARGVTVFGMVAGEFLIQLLMTYQIAKLHKKTTFNDNEKLATDKKNAIRKLILSEMSEGLVPLAYAISFLMAYYGLNAKLFGNVGNGYWQYKEVDDTRRTFFVMFVLFIMDLVCLLVNSSIIWILTKINIFKEFCIIMRKYWYILPIYMANNIYFRFYMLDVNLATDMTGNFCWITNNANISVLLNSTYECF